MRTRRADAEIQYPGFPFEPPPKRAAEVAIEPADTKKAKEDEVDDPKKKGRPSKETPEKSSAAIEAAKAARAATPPTSGKEYGNLMDRLITSHSIQTKFVRAYTQLVAAKAREDKMEDEALAPEEFEDDPNIFWFPGKKVPSPREVQADDIALTGAGFGVVLPAGNLQMRSFLTTLR
jgi:hypothetical protein